MKCILCSLKFDTSFDLEYHYLNFHKVNPDNKFYQNYLLNLKKENKYLFRKCLRCSELLPTTKFKNIHEFIRHYSEGNQELPENKPLNIEDNKIFTKYSIDIRKFGEYYDFYNSEKVISDFLDNVKARIKIENDHVIVKGSCVIENIQRSILDDIAPVKDTRYWSTEVYTVNYFNQFVYYNLAEDFSKRVINNRLTGSSWQFNRFINLSLTVLKNQKLLS